ncbi:MAG: O-antigen ligase family protein [Solirubrobacteraceae bacterium]
MITFATLNGPAPKLGVIAVALLVAFSLLTRDQRRGAWAMLGALVLAPVLLLADIWHSPQMHFVHHHPLYAAVGAALALAIVCAAAWALAPRPWLLGPLVVLALPFRVPIHAGGTTSNLLVPLYLVLAAGTLAVVIPILRDDRELPQAPEVGWVPRLLAAAVVLYSLQAIYSANFEKALQQMVFFYVPFALVFILLSRLEWTRELRTRCLQVVVALAVLFACIGFVEYATKHLLLNPKLDALLSNHTYFSINSVFFDPDIFGRFLALVMILLAAVLLESKDRRVQLGSTAVLAILWGGLVLTLSRSSLGALLVGLGVLAALKWKVWPVLAAAAVVIVIGAVVLAASPNTFGLNQGLNGASAGRANLVSGGFEMWGDRPLWGYGSGSFVTEYRRKHRRSSSTLSASHTIPITVAAEQGLIGLAVYVPLVLLAALALLRGAREDPVRAAIAAAWLALVFDTLLYADFLEDPVTWALLALGTALAAAGSSGETAAQRAAARMAPPAVSA